MVYVLSFNISYENLFIFVTVIYLLFTLSVPMYFLCLKLDVLFLYKYIGCPFLNYLLYILACNMKGKYATIKFSFKNIICILLNIVVINIIFCVFNVFLVIAFFCFFADFVIKLLNLNIDLTLRMNSCFNNSTVSGTRSNSSTSPVTTTSTTSSVYTVTSGSALYDATNLYSSSNLSEKKSLDSNYESIQLGFSSRQGTHPVDYSHIGMNRTFEYLDSGRRLQSMRELEKEYIEKYEQANRNFNKSPTTENAANMNLFSMALDELRYRKKQLKIKYDIPMASDSEKDNGEDI